MLGMNLRERTDNQSAGERKTNSKKLLFKNMIRRSAGRHARAVLVTIFILLSAIPQPSSASLVFMLYHNQALYVAGDSGVTSLKTGKRMGTVKKVYPFAENCCVTLTGSAIYDIETVSEKPFASRNFSKLLEQLSTTQLAGSAPLDEKMNAIAAGMNQAYSSLRTNDWGKLDVTETPQPIVLHFAGYDARKGCFFVHGCMLSGTNGVHIEPVKLYHGDTDTHPFVLLGELSFLQALLRGDKPELASLVSPEATATAAAIVTDESVSDARITSFILEMFQLHKSYSARFGYDKGYIDPPYLVFKVTKGSVVELAPPAKVELASPPASLAQPDPTDEQEIDEVMAKLESSFKANDYTYAFDVMYAPIVEKMGGKAQGVLAAKAIAAQMKQQQIVMVSWKAMKPYQYIRGESRTFAIVPYESVMTIGGKRLRQESYQLGIKTAGSHWQFVNGDSLNPEVFKEFFPDFPESIKLPKLERVPE
jgi:hypothetical protein